MVFLLLHLLLKTGMLLDESEAITMKNISSSLIIDEAIDKLKKIKSGPAHHSNIEDLYAVRAYCELLIKTYENKQQQLQETTGQPMVKQKLVSQSFDESDSIFDF